MKYNILLKRYSFDDRVKYELDKCILVCANCHREVKTKRDTLSVSFCCSPAWNRTKNNGLENREYIRLLTGPLFIDNSNFIYHYL